MCDCNAVKEILEYEGNISQICRWAQELLGYQFTVVHRTYKMMMDVDALSRRFGPLITQHCPIAYILHSADVSNRPDAYNISKFAMDGRTKIARTGEADQTHLPIITDSYINKVRYEECTEDRIVVYDPQPMGISSCPVLVTSAKGNGSLFTDKLKTQFRMMEVQSSLSVNYISIDDVTGFYLNGVD